MIFMYIYKFWNSTIPVPGRLKRELNKVLIKAICRRYDLNVRPADYESAALPTKLRRHLI